FDLGSSFYRDRPVLGLMLEKLPVSITLGLWTTLLVYLVSIPLGIAKAVRDGTPFDVWTSAAVIVGYAIPGFLFAILLVVLVAGFPSAFIGIFFAGELLIEVIFSLNGLGLLGFEAAVNRDYPVMFGTLYVYTLIGLLLNIVTDLTYTIIDPRIDFERRAT